MMKIQLFLNSMKMIDREISLSKKETTLIKKLSFEGRVKYREEIVNAHAADIKAKYFEAIGKAKSFEIYLVI
jgi:hypothetical protein